MKQVGLKSMFTQNKETVTYDILPIDLFMYVPQQIWHIW